MAVTWGELKELIEAAGATDDTVMDMAITIDDEAIHLSREIIDGVMNVY